MMLNVKALTDLLSYNRDGRICKSWYLMTPNGTLLAYSRPVHINDLRRQAALAALSWQEHDRTSAASADPFPRDFDEELREDAADRSPLATLTMESGTANVLLRRLQASLLLVLEGGVPPGMRAEDMSRITTETLDGRQRVTESSATTTAAMDGAEQDPNSDDHSSVANDVLQLQRKKLDALAAVMIKDFEQSGFRMPDETGATIF